MLQYLRSFLFSLFMIIATIVIAILSLFMLALPQKYRYTIIHSYGVLHVWMLKVLCGLDYRIEGTENIPETNGIIFCKHQSTWETLALQQIFPAQTFVIKRELLWIPFFGWGLAIIKPIAIDRNAGQQAIRQIVRQGIDRLQKGIWVVIFPEGTRVPPGKKVRYKLGGAILAAESGYPVTPVAHNAGEFWPKGQFLKKPGVIQVVIGPPIPSKNRKPEEILEEARNWIESTMERISGEAAKE